MVGKGKMLENIMIDHDKNEMDCNRLFKMLPLVNFNFPNLSLSTYIFVPQFPNIFKIDTLFFQIFFYNIYNLFPSKN